VYLPMQTSVSIFCDSDSEDDNTPKLAPYFTCRKRTFDFHTHTLINYLVFNLGKKALIGDRGGACKLSPDAEKHWIGCSSAEVAEVKNSWRAHVENTVLSARALQCILNLNTSLNFTRKMQCYFVTLPL
jgi:hypothetical protein